jgi:alkylation response protein AidB-like acyl-CoA dehydrogenase
MDFQLKEEHEMIREAVRAFAAKEIIPVVKEHDRAQTFDRFLHQQGDERNTS